MADFELNSDFLSSMPSEIITKILVNLPIKEAVRTSILSSKWKHSWTSIPDLVFIKDTTDSELVRSVDKVLLVHQGPILKFKIDCDKPREEAINRWLPILGHGLKDLCLWFDCFAGRKVHLSLLSCLKLEHLKLLGCIVYAPQCFQGFKLLQNLKMYACDLVGITIEEFVSSCPMLESLACCDNGVHKICLAICAPNLKQLELVGAFANLSLETPRLVCASIFLDIEIGSSYITTYDYQFSNPTSGVCKSKILQIFGKLSNIEVLKIGSSFCEYLATDPIIEQHPVAFHHLNKILIHLPGRSKEVEAALCIFRNSPMLKTLYLWVPSQNIWEEQRITTLPLFKQLEVVKILGFEDSVSMLGFAKFNFSTAPELEKLVIDKDDIYDLDDDMGFVLKLASLSRLSSKAVILFDSHSSGGDDMWPTFSDE